MTVSFTKTTYTNIRKRKKNNLTNVKMFENVGGGGSYTLYKPLFCIQNVIKNRARRKRRRSRRKWHVERLYDSVRKRKDRGRGWVFGRKKRRSARKVKISMRLLSLLSHSLSLYILSIHVMLYIANLKLQKKKKKKEHSYSKRKRWL